MNKTSAILQLSTSVRADGFQIPKLQQALFVACNKKTGRQLLKFKIHFEGKTNFGMLLSGLIRESELEI